MNSMQRFMALAENLGVDTIDDFVACYAQDAVFTDPFQTVHGRQEVRRVYLEMLHHLHLPVFRNLRIMGGSFSAAQAAAPGPAEMMLGWDFEFALGPDRPRTTIAGCSLLRFNDAGQITEHRDYWDASRLMQAFPVIGRVIGWLRKKIGQPGSP